MHRGKKNRKGCDHKIITIFFIVFRWCFFNHPCRPLAWHKLKVTDVIYLVGNKSSERIQGASYFPFHKIHDDCPTFIVIPTISV